MNLAMTVMLIAAALATAGNANADEPLRREALALFGRIEASAMSRAAPEAELGRALFWDARISRDCNTACVSCHPSLDWGADRRRYSPDARGELTSRSSPTVFNPMIQ